MLGPDNASKLQQVKRVACFGTAGKLSIDDHKLCPKAWARIKESILASKIFFSKWMIRQHNKTS